MNFSIRPSPRMRTIYLTSLVLADALFFMLTNPRELASVVLFVGFALIAASVFTVALYLLKLPEWYGLPTDRHAVRIASTVTVVSTVLLALRSVNQLGGKDMLVLVPLATISYFYLHYTKRMQREA